MFDRNFNRLTPAEVERLALLVEEVGAVHHAIGKILRHGYDSQSPLGGPTNRESLEKELGSVYHAMMRMWSAGDIDEDEIYRHECDKSNSIRQYLHHQYGPEEDDE